MGKGILRVVAWGLGGLAVLGLLIWSALFLPLFSGLRADLVARALTTAIGQPVDIEGDASLRLGRTTSRVHVSTARLPSEILPYAALARLDRLDFDLGMAALLNGRIEIDALDMDGLQVKMLRQADGTTSWTGRHLHTTAPTPDDSQPASTPATDDGLLSFLRSRSLSVRNLGLLYQNDKSGFVFDFQLTDLQQTQPADGKTTLTGRGTVNDQPFAIDGTYPEDGATTIKAAFGGVTLALDAHDAADQGPDAVNITARLDTGSIGELLDVLRLERVVDGTAQATVDLSAAPGRIAVRDMSAALDLTNGRAVQLSGTLGNLYGLRDLDVTATAAFFAKDDQPPAANRLADLRLLGLDAHVGSQDGGLKLEKLTVTTNAFDGDLKNLGPVSAERVFRTKDGTLRVDGLTVLSGPTDAPVLRATGAIGDLLQFAEVALDGTLDLPAALLFETAPPEATEALGGLQASFRLSDASGTLNLDHFRASARDTDLWTMQSDMTIDNVTKLARSDLTVDARIANGAAFLATLGLTPVDTGPVGTTLRFASKGHDVDAKGSVEVGGSWLALDLTERQPEGNPVIRGSLSSDAIALDDFANVVEAALELGTLTAATPAPATPAPAAEPEEQPFVLPKGARQQDPSKLTDPAQLLRALDLHLAITVAQLTGVQGATSINSELEIEQGTARLGPFKIRYGGGYFNLNAAMDLIETPDLIRISGGTGGWDFGKLLAEIGVNIPARGTLGARFDLTGSNASIRTFINSMRGHVTVSMGQGAIGTSLIDLAGLGVLPWLFSAELQKGYSQITCIVAPLRISGGKVTSHRIVAETPSVQLVGGGEINWRRDSIAMRVEPRPVGRPLHRSAWPFEITGRLSAPQVKVGAGRGTPHPDRARQKITGNRKPCVPDALQLEPRSARQKP